jgi:hypothetical protein
MNAIEHEWADYFRQQADINTYTLRLNASGSRRFVIRTPTCITRDELQLIQEWLGVQLIVKRWCDVERVVEEIWTDDVPS